MDMKWLSVCEAMKGKLNWAAMIAKKRQLEFAVVDSIKFFGEGSHYDGSLLALNEYQIGTFLVGKKIIRSE